MWKLSLVLLAALVATARAQDLVAIHDASLSLETEALENRYKVAALQVSVQLAATADDVETISGEVSDLREALADKGSRATFDVLNDAATNAFATVQSSLDGVTEAAGELPATMLEVNMVVSQVSAVHALFSYTEDRVNTVNSDLTQMISEGESLVEATLDLIGTQDENLYLQYSALVSKADEVEDVLGGFDFDAFRALSQTLWKQGTLNPSRPIYRYNVFSTYATNQGRYYANNNPAVYGGVTAQQWGNQATANMISANKDIQRNFYIFKGYGGWSTNFWSELWYHSSSTNTRVYTALFRIRNTSPDTIVWPVNFYHSSYGGYNDYASIAVNGQLAWQSSGSCAFCSVSQSLQIPAGRTSSVIFVANSGPVSSGMRTILLILHSGCMELPSGLEYVDDLDYVTGGWES